jgi:hypothetical protein
MQQVSGRKEGGVDKHKAMAGSCGMRHYQQDCGVEPVAPVRAVELYGSLSYEGMPHLLRWGCTTNGWGEQANGLDAFLVEWTCFF